MKKTARILITTRCNRNCPGCANDLFLASGNMLTMERISEVYKYNEIILTGGEPMLRPELVIATIKEIRLYSKAPIFMYSSTIDTNNPDVIQVLKMINGLTYTVHYEYSAKDEKMLIELSNIINDFNLTSRILVDSRLTNVISNNIVKWDNWDFKKLLLWQDDGNCPLPEHETGYYYKVF